MRLGCQLVWRGTLRAQEVSGLQAAVAIEGALTAAIAQADKSIVAIARVSRRGGEEIGPLELRPDPFGALRIPAAKPRPGDSDFVPDDYGTGVVVDKRGLILTNYHVLGDDSEYFVTTVERKVYLARVKAADPRSDLAVLSIDAHDLTPIKYGDAANLKKGQFVIALGNPYAIARDGQASASWGIIANFERKAAPTLDESNRSSKPTLHQFGTLIQTDAKLNLGTSGGALLNLKGEMIGLTTAMAAVAGFEHSAGYAIPVDDTFRRVVETLKQGREVEYGFLGVAPESLAEAEILAGKHGARVSTVVDGTPAQRFDLRPHDVITHVDGRPIYDADGLFLHVGKLPVETLVHLTVERGGLVVPVNVELAKFSVRGKKIVTAPGSNWRGMRVDYATADHEFAEHVREGKLDSRGCVIVTDVEQSSPAWNQGMRPNMAISHVGNVRVSSPKEFQAAIAGKTGPVKLRLVSPGGDHPLRSILPEVKIENPDR